MNKPKQYSIEPIPLLNLYVSTDKQRRIRLSANIVDYYKLNDGGKVMLGYDSSERAIAIFPTASTSDPSASNIDKRGYISAGRFFSRTKLTPEPRRYTFAAEQDGWLIFVAESVTTTEN